MKRRGYADSTILGMVRGLRALSKHVCLRDQLAVLDYIAKQNCTNSRKERVITYLTHYYRWIGLPFTPPIYRRVERIPFIPTEAELDELISSSGRKMACFLLVLKESASRAGEAWNLRWTDIDFENRVLTINQPEKGGRARQFKVSSKLIAMINNQPRKYDYIFRNPKIDVMLGLIFSYTLTTSGLISPFLYRSAACRNRAFWVGLPFGYASGWSTLLGLTPRAIPTSCPS